MGEMSWGSTLASQGGTAGAPQKTIHAPSSSASTGTADPVVAVLQGMQELVKTNMDLARRTLENQERVQSSKKLRDSALSSLTNHQRRLMKLCFLHLKDGYDCWTLFLDDDPLSSTFKDLVEKKDNSSILNQLESLTS